ncbi:hypothetical protein POM88_040132 [Heracleum sosnowskyi]|uniref:GED domain-containing protein n=1 Tax=Heracleum sosnowskyi TaxID=360622 RepID=A0AAD8HDI3_9APIA|nr:hypothetical protein POM88_040132 [Heracleum sosnowskyi]
MLREPEEVSIKRKRTSETLHVLQQAFQTLDELPLEADTVERGSLQESNDKSCLIKATNLTFLTWLLSQTFDELPLETDTVERGSLQESDDTFVLVYFFKLWTCY